MYRTARAADLRSCRARQVLVSDVVRHLAEGKGFFFADIGEALPKGFEEPVWLYELRWREEA